MRILLIGANGQLGSDLVRVLAGEGLVPLTHRDIEICDAGGTRMVITRHQPQIVINTAAYHRVDECETNVEKSFQVNTFGVRNLALACREVGAALVHISTDYVFDGRKVAPYVETDLPNPINVYGASKLAGEHFVRYLLDKYFIVRTSGLYGVAGSSGKGGNFVESRLKQARDGKTIRMVNDQVLSPTYTLDLAHQIHRLIQTEHYGLYHITNAGSCSWYDFTAEILKLSGLETGLIPQSTDRSGAAAQRPAYSVLENAALARLGLDEMRPWTEALAAYLREREDGGQTGSSRQVK